MKAKVLLFVVAALLVTPAFAAAGPGSSAGGNGLQGRPLESYIQDITSFAEYQEIVAPALALLKRKLPAFATEIENGATRKSWYLIPMDLRTLPSWRIGVAFPTDQIALQTLGAVWIDQDLYGRMAKVDRAILLMHELLMAHRLAARREISSSDYDDVRTMTDVLIRTQQNYDAKDLSDLVAKLNYGRYEIAATDSAFLPMSVQDLYLVFASEKLTSDLPTRGCGLDFNFDPAKGTLVLSVRPAGDSRYYNPSFEMAVSQVPQFVKEGNQYLLTFTEANEGAPKFGDLRKKFVISFGQQRIESLDASWEVYAYDIGTRSYLWQQSFEAPKFSFLPARVTCGR